MAKRAPARRRPRKAKPGTKGPDPAQSRLEQSEGSAAEAAEAVEKAGRGVVGQYKEPLGGHPTLVSILPIDKIDPTPFQRDLSDTGYPHPIMTAANPTLLRTSRPKSFST